MHSGGVRQDRTQWPMWVRLALWGIPTTRRATAVGWIALGFLGIVWLLFAAQGVYHWISLFLEGVIDAQIAAFWLGWLFMTAVIMFLSVLWYWGALRWVGRHDQWS